MWPNPHFLQVTFTEKLLNGRLHFFCAVRTRTRGFFSTVRNRHPEVFCEKSVLKGFKIFTGKHLSQGLFFNKVADLRPAYLIIKRLQSLFFNKVAGLRPEFLLKQRLWHRCFPVKLAKFLTTSFFTRNLRWLLPNC